MSDLLIDLPAVPSGQLSERLDYAEAFVAAPELAARPLADWKMEEGDLPILQYLYRNHRPLRHLEFGTWKGAGTVACLEACAASVWTINLPEGERDQSGEWAYWEGLPEGDHAPKGAVTRQMRNGDWAIQTDARGAIGIKYVEKGLGHRVCQIYCDSRDWDTSAYPAGFFDSCLIDGGHTAEIVRSDLEKAIPLLRRGGLLMLHDFCPVAQVLEACSAPRGVLAAVQDARGLLAESLTDLFWVQPSWLLVGVRR